VSGGTGQQPSRLLAGVPAGEGSEAMGTRVVRSGDEKGACRKGYRESELSVVPRKQGNAPERTLWREGKAG
jgi:hypothetical protein